jgi:hypothetical protein
MPEGESWDVIQYYIDASEKDDEPAAQPEPKIVEPRAA